MHVHASGPASMPLYIFVVPRSSWPFNSSLHPTCDHTQWRLLLQLFTILCRAQPHALHRLPSRPPESTGTARRVNSPYHTLPARPSQASTCHHFGLVDDGEAKILFRKISHYR